MKRLLILSVSFVLIAASVAGCNRQTFKYDNRTPGATQEVARTHYLWGLSSPKKPVIAHQICPTGVAKVEVVHTFGDQFLGCLTLGIYSPNTVNVTCAAGGAHNFYLDENEKVVAHEVLDKNGKVVSINTKPNPNLPTSAF